MTINPKLTRILLNSLLDVRWSKNIKEFVLYKVKCKVYFLLLNEHECYDVKLNLAITALISL